MRISESKTAVPELHAGFTTRPRLLAQLDRATADQLVVVVAPPGYGKTLLLADWVRRGGPRTAWVSVDEDDDAPRLVSSLLTALRKLPALRTHAELHRIEREAGEHPGATVIDEIADVLDGLRPPVRVVLDDLHELGAEALREVARLVRRHPAGLRLVLSCRADPPLSLARMRLQGTLRELRAEHLSFTLDEASALLGASGLDLTPAQVARLQARTEGWAAGLRLAALALRNADDPDGLIASFSGSERSVADYLTGEVLADLREDSRDLLRAVSVCSTLPLELAVELTGLPHAGRILDDLRRDSALVERTGPGTFRIHGLLRTYLLAELARHRPHLHRTLQQTAARWWTAADDPVHALRHAERAGEPTLAADLVRRLGIRLLARGETGPVRRALAAVEPARRSADPWLALTAALLHLQEHAVDDAVADLEQARQVWPSAPDAELDVLRTAVELLVPGARTDERSAPAHGDVQVAPELDLLRRLGRGAAALRSSRRDADGLVAALDDVVARARRGGFAYVEVRALSLRAVLAAGRGRHQVMASAARDTLTAAARLDRNAAGWSAVASAMLAYADLLAGDPAAARARTEEVLAAAPGPLVARLVLGVVHAAAVGDQGDRAAGLAESRAARASDGDAAAPGLLAAMAVLEHRAALLHPVAAADLVRWLERRTGRVGEVLLLAAWTHQAAGRHEAACEALGPLRAGAVAPLLPQTRLEAHLVHAEAALHVGDVPGAVEELDAALARGAASRTVRPFALAGPLTRELLPTRPAARSQGWFGARLAAALQAVHADTAPVLSERELVVLALLPSLLSGGEIADELMVSVNTVKSHIRSIYTKLGVSTRREAVVRALEHGLLP